MSVTLKSDWAKKSIETHYIGPTNFLGARIVATDCGDHKVTISYPHEHDGLDAQFQAAKALADKLGWTGEMIGAATKAGFVFVFAD